MNGCADKPAPKSEKVKIAQKCRAGLCSAVSPEGSRLTSDLLGTMRLSDPARPV